jgi:hypothetical protein
MNRETCEGRVECHLEDRLADIRTIFAAEGWEWLVLGERVRACQDLGISKFAARRDELPDDCDWHADSFYEYGLSFDYVAPGTFQDQNEGYFRWQISWGGPSEEFRFYVSPGGSVPYRVEFWLLDWFDGARRQPCGTDLNAALEVWERFRDSGEPARLLSEAEA